MMFEGLDGESLHGAQVIVELPPALTRQVRVVSSAENLREKHCDRSYSEININLIIQSEGLLSIHVARSPAPSLVCGARGGVGHHVVAPLLVLLPDGVVVLGVGSAHDEELLVLHLEVAVATPLLRVSHVLYTGPRQQERSGRGEEGGSGEGQ